MIPPCGSDEKLHTVIEKNFFHCRSYIVFQRTLFITLVTTSYSVNKLRIFR